MNKSTEQPKEKVQKFGASKIFYDCRSLIMLSKAAFVWKKIQ